MSSLPLFARPGRGRFVSCIPDTQTLEELIDLAERSGTTADNIVEYVARECLDRSAPQSPWTIFGGITFPEAAALPGRVVWLQSAAEEGGEWRLYFCVAKASAHGSEDTTYPAAELTVLLNHCALFRFTAETARWISGGKAFEQVCAYRDARRRDSVYVESVSEYHPPAWNTAETHRVLEVSVRRVHLHIAHNAPGGCRRFDFYRP